MIRFRKPELIPLLFIIGAEIMLVWLGAWQIERLAWKNNLIAEIEHAQSAPPLTVLPKELTGLEYHAVELKGQFIPDKTLRKVGSRQGEHSGFTQLVPFKMKDDRVILVSRGFVPSDVTLKPDAKTPLTVKGVLRPAYGRRAFFIPDNQPGKNVWLFEDIAAMSAATKLDMLPLIVEATGTYQKNIYPIPSDGKIALRNDHLGYAITWFSLAIAALLMFGIYYRERRAPKVTA